MLRYAGRSADDRRSTLMHRAMNKLVTRPLAHARHLLSAARQGDCKHRALARAVPGAWHAQAPAPVRYRSPAALESTSRSSGAPA
ncbi:hypothetical protein DGN16_18475 [Xanthomonas citri pv. fuscans]|uniref:Uncharacterized protein n=1 Tax=Xanthomonas citri pv. phaseoli var. fuscans TaxID=473423 RepID=A0A808FM43_XANCI|nr:hypothetical protein DGN16_18475 [Xanthomonas citri pv. fuscans]QWN09050.1 hypothetical protein DGN11_17980 [Xanthomonas citri pv. fuscans]QWN13243.1 hypothetical protein DGN07_18430 [Xanthomonas citri pv. fuscans]QWN22867.1 hypothetical protein DGM98_18305 [Xanthomonas citri]